MLIGKYLYMKHNSKFKLIGAALGILHYQIVLPSVSQSGVCVNGNCQQRTYFKELILIRNLNLINNLCGHPMLFTQYTLSLVLQYTIWYTHSCSVYLDCLSCFYLSIHVSPCVPPYKFRVPVSILRSGYFLCAALHVLLLLN